MENQVVNNVFVNKVVYKLYLWKNIMKMVINLVMCTTNGYIIFLKDPRTIWNYNILYISTAKLNTKRMDLPSTPNR